MNSELIEKAIRELITKTSHLSLATVQENKPWVCEVHFGYDEDLNLYFVSKPSTRHCGEIAKNPNVAGSVVKQHLLTESPNGLYFEGLAEMIEPIDEQIKIYAEALSRDTDQTKELLSELGGRRMYKITVKNWVVFGNIDGSGHTKHELSWGNQ